MNREKTQEKELTIEAGSEIFEVIISFSNIYVKIQFRFDPILRNILQFMNHKITSGSETGLYNERTTEEKNIRNINMNEIDYRVVDAEIDQMSEEKTNHTRKIYYRDFFNIKGDLAEIIY